MLGWLKRLIVGREHAGTFFDARDALLKRMVANYDAAQNTTENQNHWLAADAKSPLFANGLAVRQTLRNRARYETGNNCYANGMCRTLAYHCVGTGPTLSIEGEDPFDREVEDQFGHWSEAINLAEKLRQMREARVRDGESFAMLTTNPRVDHAVKMDVVTIEADRISDLGSKPDSPRNCDGITYDEWGNPVTYSLLNGHPGDPSFTMTSTPIPAEFMIHWFRADRPGQVRGIPEITPALPLYAMLRRYTKAVLGTAEIAAMMSLFLKTTSPAVDPSLVDPYDIIPVERNTMMTMPEGWDVQQLKAEQPTTTHDMFTRTVLREIARCLDMPFNVAAGDSSSYNYSSGKLDHQTYFRSIDIDRHTCEVRILNRIFRAWFDDALLTARLFSNPRTNLGRLMSGWDWPPWEHVDPFKESQATTNDLTFGLTSIPTEHARRGKRWEREWTRQARALGITLPEFQKRMADKLFAPPSQMQTNPTGDNAPNPAEQAAAA